MLILFSFARCHVCWCMQTCNMYKDSTIIFYFLFYRDSSITWQAIFNQGESHQRTQHAGDVVGSQAWADERIKTNVAQKNIHTLFFLVVEDFFTVPAFETKQLAQTIPEERRAHLYFRRNEKRGYCVFAPILNPNCDFTLIFFHFVFLPLLFQNKGSVYPYSVNSR